MLALDVVLQATDDYFASLMLVNWARSGCSR